MMQLHQDYQMFTELNTEIIVIGPEKAKTFQKYWIDHKLNFVGLPDPTHTVLNLYEQQVKLLKLGRMPAQFIIDKSGIIRYAHYSESMANIPSNNEILDLLKTMI